MYVINQINLILWDELWKVSKRKYLQINLNKEIKKINK